jgi:hypothetical protein
VVLVIAESAVGIGMDDASLLKIAGSIPQSSTPTISGRPSIVATLTRSEYGPLSASGQRIALEGISG